MSADHDHLELPSHHPRVARSEHDAPGRDLQRALGNQGVGKVLHTTAVQRSGSTAAQQLDESVARAIQDRRGRGTPLDHGVRTEMEQALGHDLSDVRVHADGAAHELNEAVSARAFTAGDDVFFKQGTYDPSSSAGKELLGHELTHVVQQRTGTSGLDGGQVSDPSDPAEVAAAATGRRIASEAAAAPAAAVAAPGVARQDEEEEFMMSRAAEPEEDEELMMSRAAEPEEDEELMMSRAAEHGQR